MLFSNNYIEKVEGTADGITLIFIKNEEGEWSSNSIPIDYEDG